MHPSRRHDHRHFPFGTEVPAASLDGAPAGYGAPVNRTLPLAGVEVLELSGTPAAGLAGRFLQGYGARVVRVDPGFAPPLTADEARYLHQGKLSAPCDDGLHLLLDAADLVLSDVQPAGLASLGIDWSTRHSAQPRQVIVSVTPFGLTGPYADFRHTNATAFALGGIMGLTGSADRSPLVTGGNQAYALAGINAFGAATTAWLGLLRHGRGDVVDISGQACAAGMLEYYSAYTSYTGLPTVRLGNQTRATWGVYPCLDGWAGVFALERQTPPLFALLDDPDLDEPRFRDPLQRLLPENDEELTAKLYVWFADKTKAELRDISLATKVPIGTATTPNELLESTGLAHRGFFDTITDERGDARIPGRPVPGFGWQPASGEPTHTRDEIPAATATPALPLGGLKVIDLTMMWAGPFATLHLASMGADVIKVESPSAWDNIRTLVPQPGVEDPWNSAYYFQAYNRDKRSLTLDLAQQAGRDLLLKLVADADVLIENYRADVLDKLGLTDEVLARANPRLVTVSMAAFGKEGPDREYVGFGPVIELMSGLTSLSGYEGDEEPFKTGISYGDPVAGLNAVAAIVLGLIERDATGRGCHVDLAQRETGMVLIGEAFVAASRGEEPVHRGCRDARFAPQGAYRVRGEDQWLVVSVRTDDEWRALCGLLGRNDLAGLPVDERRARHDELDTVLAEWLQPQRPQLVMERLQAGGVPAGRVLDCSAVHDDLQLLHRDFWVYLPNPKMIRHKQQGVPWRLVDAAPEPRRHAPFFGEHNAEILTELGLTETDLAGLTARRVVATAPINPGVG